MVNDFQKRLRKMREKKGLRQRTLSELCGLYPEAISKYERGTKPDVEALFSLADFFGCTADFLWRGENN